MADIDPLMSLLIQRTPHIEDLLEHLTDNEFQTVISLKQTTTQFLKARRLYDLILYDSIQYSDEKHEDLRQAFIATENKPAGELLFFNRTRLLESSINFWRGKLEHLNRQLSKNLENPNSAKIDEELLVDNVELFCAVKTGNVEKLTKLLNDLTSLCIYSCCSESEIVSSDFDHEALIKAKLDGFRSGLRNYLLQKSDWSHRTLLHMAIYANGCKCLEIILEYAHEAGIKSAMLDSKDYIGNTALHLAVRKQHVILTRILILEGADVFLNDNTGHNSLQLIYEFLPKASVCLLDKAITVSGDVSSDSLFLNVDFSILVSYIDFNVSENLLVVQSNKMVVNEHFMTTIDDVSPCVVPLAILPIYTTMPLAEQYGGANRSSDTETIDLNLNLTEEMNTLFFLMKTDKRACSQICAHPVTQLLLRLKWRCLKKFFFRRILVRVSYCLLYYLLIFLIYYVDCPAPHAHGAQKTNKSCVEGDDGKPAAPIHCQFSRSTFWLIPPVIVVTVILFCREALRVYHTAAAFRFKGLILSISLGSWFQMLFLVIVPLTVLTPYFQDRVRSYQYLYAVFGILLGSVHLLRALGESNADCGIQSIYVHVYMRVFWRFVSVILTFSPAFLGFAISFSIIFAQPNTFSTFSRQVFRLFIMIHGEFDFEETSLKTCENEAKWVFWTGQVLFVLFGSFVTLVLIDVFLGYTVSDINDLRERAEDRRRFIQIEQMYLAERLRISVANFMRKLLKRSKSDEDAGISVIDARHRRLHRNNFMLEFQELPESLQAEFRKIISQE